jgi:hypothetical protein
MRGAFWLTPRIAGTRFATIGIWSASSITAMGRVWLIRTCTAGGTTTGGTITVTSGAGIYVTDWFRDTGFQAQGQVSCIGTAWECTEACRSATGAPPEDIADARPAGLQPE